MPSPTAAPPAPAKLGAKSALPLMIFAYTLLLQLALAPLLFFLYGMGPDPFRGVSLSALVPRGLDDHTTLACYAVGLGAFVLAFQLPAVVLRRSRPGSSAGAPASLPCLSDADLARRAMGPYVIRLCLLETCTIAGFVLGFLLRTPLPILPFAALGVVATAASAPTPAFFARFARISR